MATKKGPSSSEKNAARLIAIQECAATAVRLTGSNIEAHSWLERDYARAMAAEEEHAKQHNVGIPEGDERRMEAKETKKMKLVKETYEWLMDHMAWDGTIRYDLLGKGEVK